MIAKKNYIASYLLLSLLLFLTVILFINYFTLDVQNALIILVILVFFSIISFFKFEISLLLFIFFIPLYHVIGRFFNVSEFFTIVAMFIGCLFGGIFYLAKQKKLLIDLNLKISVPIIIFIIFMTISFLFVYLRIYDYISLYKHFTRDYALNVNLRSSAEGFNLAIYQYFNYFCGFLILFLITKVNITRKFIVRLFYTLFLTNSIVFLSLLYQVIVNPYFMGQSTGIGDQSWIAANTFTNRYGSILVDPNSLGIYSIIILLSFIGFTYYFKVKSKIIISVIAIFECLVLLMLSGSRTGLLGLLLIILFYIFVLIYFIVRKIYRRRKINNVSNRKILLISAASFLIIIILFSAASIFTLKSLDDDFLPVTLKRIKTDVLLFSEGNLKAAIDNFLGGRKLLWKAAYYIVKDYPISGIGIGMITVELPNYGRSYGINELSNDMADNYYLQVMAELGIFALIVNLWIFWAVIKPFRMAMVKIKDTRLKYLILNIFLILPVMLIMFVFGPHTYFMEISFLFYFFIGVVVNFGYKYTEN